MYAAANKKMDVVKLLLEKGGVDIDAKHDNGGTALLEAATAGAFDSLKFLMDHGADFDGVDDDGVSALMGVASAGSLEGVKLVVEALKKKGTFDSHLDRLSYSGGSPVMFAAAGGHTDCVKELIELGSNINAIAKATPEYAERLKKMIAEGTMTDLENTVDGVTALHVAAQGGHLDTVNLLLENGAIPTIADDDNRTPLTLAIKGNYGEVAAALVKYGADPNTVFVDDENVTHNLLFDSILIENVDFAISLIEKGADLYYKDDKGVTTLLQASHRGLLDVVEKLLQAHKTRGSNDDYIGASSEEGVSPLIAAASEGHPEIVKALLAAGANKDDTDVDGTSALMAAAARGHLDVVKELIAAGADVNVQNNDGHSALMFAYNGKNQVETLFERYSQYLKESEGEEDSDGGTGPVIREALASHTAVVDLLLKNGANPKLKDKEGHTAKDFDYNPDADSEVLDKQSKIARDESKSEL
jgi:ankyrin repeat protein